MRWTRHTAGGEVADDGTAQGNASGQKRAGESVGGKGVEYLRDYAKELLSQAIRPFAWALLRWHVTPNMVSVTGVLLNLVTALLVVLDRPLLAALMYLAAGGLDLLDGVLARMAKMATRFGAFLDSTADRISEGVVFAAIAYHFAQGGQPVNAGVVVLALLGSLLVSYTRARAEGLGLECKVGFVTRAERVILVAFGLLFGLLPQAIYLLVALTALTVAQRVLHTLRQLTPQG
jgi:CDP-diacylglycerol---glycerol-3-phosphate 3-phosphatidyltransferase